MIGSVNLLDYRNQSYLWCRWVKTRGLQIKGKIYALFDFFYSFYILLVSVIALRLCSSTALKGLVEETEVE